MPEDDLGAKLQEMYDRYVEIRLLTRMGVYGDTLQQTPATIQDKKVSQTAQAKPAPTIMKNPDLVEIARGVPVLKREYDVLAEICAQFGATPKELYREKLDHDTGWGRRCVGIDGQHVTYIQLGNRYVSYLPDTLGILTELKCLAIYEDNYLTTLPQSIGELRNLETLRLDRSSNLSSLPYSIGNLRHLKYLLINGTINTSNLVALPASIGELASLEELILEFHPLQELPNSIGNLYSLRRLDLQANKLQRLPNSVGYLSNLEDLCLWTNKIQELPESLGNLKKLRSLGLFNNPIRRLPESVKSFQQEILIEVDSSVTYPSYLPPNVHIRNSIV